MQPAPHWIVYIIIAGALYFSTLHCMFLHQSSLESVEPLNAKQCSMQRKTHLKDSLYNQCTLESTVENQLHRFARLIHCTAQNHNARRTNSFVTHCTKCTKCTSSLHPHVIAQICTFIDCTDFVLCTLELFDVLSHSGLF